MMRWRIPLIRLFDHFHDELLRIEFWIRLVEWLNEHQPEIYKGLHAVEAPLAERF